MTNELKSYKHIEDFILGYLEAKNDALVEDMLDYAIDELRHDFFDIFIGMTHSGKLNAYIDGVEESVCGDPATCAVAKFVKQHSHIVRIETKPNKNNPDKKQCVMLANWK